MALQQATFLTGKINNVVFFKRAGAYMARSLPAVVKQSAATQIRSKNFGIAAAAGKSLRQLLQPILPFPKNRVMQIRFSGAIAQWLGLEHVATLPVTHTVPVVSQFNFNDHTSIAERWKLPLTVLQQSDNLIEIHLPSFEPAASLAAPAHTVEVECIFTAASCQLATGAVLGSSTHSIRFSYHHTVVNAQVIALPVPAVTGAMVITAARLQYRLANLQYCDHENFMPASVIDARYC